LLMGSQLQLRVTISIRGYGSLRSQGRRGDGLRIEPSNSVRM